MLRKRLDEGTSLAELIPNLEEEMVGFDQYRADSRVFESIRAELVEKYPDQWVAFRNGEVVAYGTKQKQVIKELDGIGLRRHTVLQFLATNPPTLIV